MGASSENFCLRWNDFESNISNSFRELREDSDFLDVTLVASDSGNRVLQAHKVILSACSSFFKDVLRQQSKIQSHPHPIIYLRGVTYNDLLAVLDFMYHGEVNVAQDDLNSFLAVAEELQIKGLTNKEQSDSSSCGGGGVGIGSNAGSSRSRPHSSRVKDGFSGPAAKRSRRASPNQSQGISTLDDDTKDIKVKMDPESSMASTGEPDESMAVNPDEEGYDDSYGDFYPDDGNGGLEGDGSEDLGAGGSVDGAKDLICGEWIANPPAGLARLGTGQGKCLDCGKTFSNFSNAKTHYREFHSNPRQLHQCHICGAKFGLSRSRANHLLKIHGISQKMIKNAEIVNK